MGPAGKPGIEVCGKFSESTTHKQDVEVYFSLIFTLRMLWPAVLQLFYNNSLHVCQMLAACIRHDCQNHQHYRGSVCFSGPSRTPRSSWSSGKRGEFEMSLSFHIYSLPHTSADKRWLEA